MASGLAVYSQVPAPSHTPRDWTGSRMDGPEWEGISPATVSPLQVVTCLLSWRAPSNLCSRNRKLFLEISHKMVEGGCGHQEESIIPTPGCGWSPLTVPLSSSPLVHSRNNHLPNGGVHTAFQGQV